MTPTHMITYQEAREVMGSNHFFDTKAANALFGCDLKEEDIKHVPFNYTEMEAQEAKRSGRQIGLHIKKMQGGKKANMSNIHEHIALVRHQFAISNMHVYRGSAFLETADNLEWRETSEIIPDSLGQNYLEQTETLIHYIRTQIFPGMPLPIEVQIAINEFELVKTYIKNLLENWHHHSTEVGLVNEASVPNWQRASQVLTGLKINQLARPTAISILQDALYGNLHRLDSVATWTTDLSPQGIPIGFGLIGAQGGYLGSWMPGNQEPHIGTIFSRSLSRPYITS